MPIEISSTSAAASLQALLVELQAEYSMILYGGSNRVATDNLQLLWTPLLSSKALQTVEALGVCHWQPDPPERMLFYPYSMHANPFGSLWRKASLPISPTPSYSWVEVTHCAKPGAGADRLPWLYVAHGSGVSLNVGSSAVIDLQKHPRCSALGAYALQNLRQGFKSLLRKCINNVDVQVDALDSVQLLHALDWYTAEERLEIILLSTAVLSESQSILDATRASVALDSASSVTNATARIMCGRWPHLFPCDASNPAISYMSRCNATSSMLIKHAMRPCGRTGSCSPCPMGKDCMTAASADYVRRCNVADRSPRSNGSHSMQRSTLN